MHIDNTLLIYMNNRYIVSGRRKTTTCGGLARASARKQSPTLSTITLNTALVNGKIEQVL
jgi:hypothetical protein